MRKKGRIRMPEGYISTEEATKMLGISRCTVNRYFEQGVLAGEQHPITNLRRINKASVLALMEKHGMECEREIELQGNSDSRKGTDTSGQGAENDGKKHSAHCG